MAQGRRGLACSLPSSALAIAREVGDRRFEGLWLGNLGQLGRDNPAEARARIEGALVIARELGDRRQEGVWLCQLAGWDLVSGEDTTAGELARASEAIVSAVGDKFQLGMIACVRGHIALAMGRSALGELDRARRSLTRSAPEARATSGLAWRSSQGHRLPSLKGRASCVAIVPKTWNRTSSDRCAITIPRRSRRRCWGA